MNRQHRFPAFGTTACVTVRRARDLRRAVRVAGRVVADVDAACSRFRRDSDLARVNASPGRWVRVDPLLVAAVEVARDAARQTEGLVNPLLGRPLVELGYDRDLALVRETDVNPDDTPLETAAPGATAWQQIGLDPDGAVRIPEGTALDLGATAKAWAADLIAAAWEETLGAGALVGLGGDLRVAAPDAEPWPVALSERPDEAPAETVLLDRGGLATSSTRVRRWTRGGVRRHHLLDPRTGLPVLPTWRTVTATGPTCAAANIASTMAVVLRRQGLAWLTAHHVSARLVDQDGGVTVTGGWPDERRVA